MPYADKAKRNEMLRRRARERREQGLCHECNNPAVEGMSRCEEHRKRREE